MSGDDGSVWYEVPYDRLSPKHFYAWRLWSFDLPVDAEGWLEPVVRCWDNALNTQPTFVRSTWFVQPFLELALSQCVTQFRDSSNQNSIRHSDDRFMYFPCCKIVFITLHPRLGLFFHSTAADVRVGSHATSQQVMLHKLLRYRRLCCHHPASLLRFTTEYI